MPSDKPGSRACLLPWQSMMIASDGSLRPCCNSLRSLGDGRAVDVQNLWNTCSSVSLRRELLTDALDATCRVCKSQNVEPPEEVVPDIYTHDTIACDRVLSQGLVSEWLQPPMSRPVRQWPGSSGRLVRWAASPGPRGKLEVAVAYPPGDRRPAWFFVQSLRDATVASAAAIPMARGKCLVTFEVNPASFGDMHKLDLIALDAEGQHLMVPWESEDDVALNGAILLKRAEKYPVLSELPVGSHLVGCLDECYLVGSSLRCKGWAFDRRFKSCPDLVAIFLGCDLLAVCATKGERYDVAKALSASEAVDSGFFVLSDVGPKTLKDTGEVAAIALFESAHYAFLAGTARPFA